MHSFYNTKSKNGKKNFRNLSDAIKLHDDKMVLGILRDNPNIIKLKTNDNITIPMLAAKAGCSECVFQAILEKSAEILNEKSNSGETVESILKENGRIELLNQYYHFTNSPSPPR